MNKLLDKNNYIIVDNFIDPYRAKELHDQFIKDSKKDKEHFSHDGQCPKSISIYDYKPFLELLVEKSSHMSRIMDEPMLPTYSYARLYKKGEVLEKHKDRPACEVSVTLHLGSEGDEWPIYFTKPNGDVAEINLKPGQAAIYLGMISEHWRNKFKGKNYSQVFLHYVKSRGENWIYYFDKRR